VQISKFIINFRITQFGGFSLFVDYGHRGDRNTTSFRAYQNHQLVDPLSNPGAIDLTADVDFGYWQRILKDLCLTFGPIEQRQVLSVFLEIVFTCLIPDISSLKWEFD
jgi:NADH dehydrogenase [ubiquinone] 1 alpha subcomplex assembly factor 7